MDGDNVLGNDVLWPWHLDVDGNMTKFWHRLFGLTPLIAACALFLSSPAAAQVSIVAFGTSFTNGKGVSAAEKYPAQLERMLRAKGYNVTVKNAGLDGDSAAVGVARLDSAVPTGTTIAILEFGVNENCPHCTSKTYSDAERAQVVPNIAKMVRTLGARGTKVIIINGMRGVMLDGAAVGIARLAAATRGLNSPEYLLPNDTHLSGTAYGIVAARLSVVIQEMLGKPKG